MAFTKINAAGIGTTERVTVDGLTVINNLSVGGTVSIAGTLTYEDVTNVDSVGLITARNGIVVGSGITLSKDGDGFFTGVVTATSYYGDGSNLSNITSTTINSNADNRLITGSGTANTLNGESGLTYDGSTLAVTGAITASTSITATNNLVTNGNFTVSGTNPNIFLTDTDNDSDFRISNSNGVLEFRDTTNSVTRLNITSDGKIGINQSPTRELSVHSPNNNNALIHFTNDDTGETSSDGILLGLDGNENMNINHQETGKDINLYMGGSQRLKIDSYGRVLIGGTSAIIGSSSEFSEIVLTGKTRGAGVTLQDEDANVRFQIRTDDDVSSFQGTLLNASTNHGISIRTNNTEKIRLRANGLQTITYQYFLHADRSGDQTGFNAGGDFGTPMIFNDIVTENKDSTLSSCFNTSNGLFTAPVPGTYLFIASAYTSSGNVLQQSWFTLNGGRANGTDIVANNTSSYSMVFGTTIMRLAAGNTVGFKPYGSGQSNLTISDNANHTYLKVTLLS